MASFFFHLLPAQRGRAGSNQSHCVQFQERHLIIYTTPSGAVQPQKEHGKRVFISYHFHHGERHGATLRSPRLSLFIIVYHLHRIAVQQHHTWASFHNYRLSFASPKGHNLADRSSVHNFVIHPALAARHRTLFLSSFLISFPFIFNCSTEWFFCGGFFKAKKVFCFSHAPAELCALGSSTLTRLGRPGPPDRPGGEPRRGSAGPWAPWRPFPDQKVGRRRSGARLFAFLSNDFSFFGRHGLPFPSRPSLLLATAEMTPARKRRNKKVVRLRQWRAAFLRFCQTGIRIFWTPLPHFLPSGGGRLL